MGLSKKVAPVLRCKWLEEAVERPEGMCSWQRGQQVLREPALWSKSCRQGPECRDGEV